MRAARSRSLAERTGHWRSRSTVSRPFSKQQMSSATPDSSGPWPRRRRGRGCGRTSALSERSPVPGALPLTAGHGRRVDHRQARLQLGAGEVRMQRSPAAMASCGRKAVPSRSFNRATVESGDFEPVDADACRSVRAGPRRLDHVAMLVQKGLVRGGQRPAQVGFRLRRGETGALRIPARHRRRAPRGAAGLPRARPSAVPPPPPAAGRHRPPAPRPRPSRPPASRHAAGLQQPRQRPSRHGAALPCACSRRCVRQPCGRPPFPCLCGHAWPLSSGGKIIVAMRSMALRSASNCGSSRRSSMTWQAWLTVVAVAAKAPADLDHGPCAARHGRHTWRFWRILQLLSRRSRRRDTRSAESASISTVSERTVRQRASMPTVQVRLDVCRSSGAPSGRGCRCVRAACRPEVTVKFRLVGSDHGAGGAGERWDAGWMGMKTSLL